MNVALIAALILVSFSTLTPLPPGARPFLYLSFTILLTFAAPLAGYVQYALLRRRAPFDPQGRLKELARYRTSRLTLSVLALVVFYAQLNHLFYPGVLYVLLGRRAPILLFRLLCLLPYLVSSILLYVPRYLTERDLGLAAQRSLRSYVVFYVRTSVLIFLIPWLFLISVQDLLDSDLVPKVFRDPANREYITAALVDFLIVLVLALAPVFLRFIWSSRPLPESPLRSRLLDFSRRVGFRCRDILVWDTGGAGHVNAAVAGLFPRLRYVFITDALLASMTEDEILAVFGHEIAHAKLSHIPFFLVFLVAFSFLPNALLPPLDTLSAHLRMSPVAAQWAGILVLFGGYWGLLFGYISRRFERQADLYGAAWTTVDSFVNALEKLASLNGIPRELPSWRHFSIAHRVAFLASTRSDPRAVDELERSLHLAMLSFLAVTCVAVVLALLGNFTDLL
ncbi:MAG: M48 family metallopeptidase [Planctomycetota bacterium]